MRPERDSAVQSVGTVVEGDDVVIRLNEAPCHRKTHVAQANKSDLHFDRLVLADLPARAAGESSGEIVTMLLGE